MRRAFIIICTCCCVVESVVKFRKLLQKSEVFISCMNISIDELLLVSAYSYKDEMLTYDDDYDMKDDDVDR